MQKWVSMAIAVTVAGLSFASTVKRVLSDVTSHPGKALLGCSYSVEIKD